jgi:hypothetical protein
MKKESIENVFSTMLVISGCLLILWWILLGVSQAVGNGGASLLQLAQSGTWVPVNIIGLVALLLLVFGIMGILIRDYSNLGAFGFSGVIISTIGVILFTSLQFDETFVWPLLATYADTLLEIKGPMFTDPGFFTAYIIMGLLFIVGFVFIAIQSLRRNIFPKVPGIFLIIGTPVFAGGLFVPVIVRTIGLILMSVAFIWIGFFNLKRSG